jgi:hypothetical protein
MPYNLSITSFTDDLETTVNAPTGGAFQTAPVARYGGRQRIITGNFEVATTDIDSGDLIVLARLPATSTIQSILLSNDDLDGGTALDMDLGIFDENGTVLDQDYFAIAVVQLATATAAPGAQLLHEAATGPERVGDRLWEMAGVATDPGGVMYDIVITIVDGAATAQAGTIGYEIRYTID